jgi:hypothetical protein
MVDINARAIMIKMGQHDPTMRDMPREPKIVTSATSSVPALMICRTGELVNLKLIWSNASWNVNAGKRKSSPTMKQAHVNGLTRRSGAWRACRVSRSIEMDWAAFVADIRGTYRGRIVREFVVD